MNTHPWGVVLHLLVADDGLTEGHVYRRYLALCGELLPTSELPPSTCPDDCEFDVLDCSECVRGAAQWTAEAQRAERASESPPVSAAMRWGLSVLDRRSHAINKQAEHPLGVFKAECGHLLMMVTTLHEKPSGEPCETCATLQLARAVTDGSGRSRPPGSGDDEPDPLPWAVYVGDCGHHRVMSNPAHIGPCPDCDAQIGAP